MYTYFHNHNTKSWHNRAAISRSLEFTYTSTRFIRNCICFYIIHTCLISVDMLKYKDIRLSSSCCCNVVEFFLLLLFFEICMYDWVIYSTYICIYICIHQRRDPIDLYYVLDWRNGIFLFFCKRITRICLFHRSSWWILHFGMKIEDFARFVQGRLAIQRSKLWHEITFSCWKWEKNNKYLL